MTFPLVLIAAFSAGFLAQGIKILLKLRNERFSSAFLDAYGGMPSAHSAFLMSLVVSVAIAEGIDSSAFGIAALLGAILIRDALGLRMILEQHGVLLKQLSDTTPQKNASAGKKGYTPGDRVGHTLPEVLVGSTIGALTALAVWGVSLAL